MSHVDDSGRIHTVDYILFVSIRRNPVICFLFWNNKIISDIYEQITIALFVAYSVLKI